MDITSSSSSDLSNDETSSSDYELENASVLTSEELLSPISDDCDTDILDISMDSEVLPSPNDHYTEERFDHQVTKDIDKEFGYIVVGDNLDQTADHRYFTTDTGLEMHHVSTRLT